VILTFPNILTLTRILLTPLFVILILKNLFSLALLVFSIAVISDGLDGLWAKYFKQQSVLGAYLDPIADKLLLSAAFVSLAALCNLPPCLAVLVVSRDILIVTGIAVCAIAGINIEMKPSTVSKLTTFFQMAAVIITLFDLTIVSVDLMKRILYWLTAGLTVTSGLHYIYVGLHIIQNNAINNQTPKDP
jgi:cardiolipin synthase